MTRNASDPRLTVLGSGTSTGVPMIGCTCSVCRSSNPRNKRLRASVWIEWQGKSILVDTSTDFRHQALREQIPRIDAVLFTHPHADHIHGIDDLRAYNFKQQASIPAYGHEWTCSELRAKFPYVFSGAISEGGGLPQIDLHEFDPHVPEIQVAGLPVIPLFLEHGSKHSVGYRFDSIAYVTDCSYIPKESLDRMRGLSVLVLDCVRHAPHRTHFHLDQAIKTIEELKPQRTYLTHLNDEFDDEVWHQKWKEKLPHGVSLAYDGLKIQSEG